MNVDQILRTLNDQQVDYMLIGGMNFLIRHVPELTFDVDIWVRDDADNLSCVSRALRTMGAEWGRSDADWKPVPEDWNWLKRQSVFCMTTRFGALDVFRDVFGLEGKYAECRARAVLTKTGEGISFFALSDPDMLACQEALPVNEQKSRRIEVLRAAIEKRESQ